MKPTPGKSLFSTVDATTVVVIRWGETELDLTCGGAPMTDTDPKTVAAPPTTGATQLGKRYTTEDGSVELLCTKPGDGELAIDGVALGIKSATPLPASD
ncbi:hypothetical protein GIY30_18430 [Gordonia sp. HNM0687]|uniref:Uncharacterized protein n=1 Tax=Gordonia mangrovi TaxID=2665643 RepID=A0A6L7GV25_9ACTN|nr:hypothetical protein [Gordonia mangrovi]MXP23317.1 hypothetical protein [Gordonia mangrovi]UVF76769.1 hypothetical protein NWF22_15590 [Gordonia mangrovi]